MGFPTISRGFGVRDDYLDASLTTLNSASVSTDTFTSDGDIVTWNVTMTNPSNGDVAILYRPVVSGPDPSVYSVSIVRANVTSWANATNFQLRPWVAYTPSGTTDTGQNSLINTTSFNNFIPVNSLHNRRCRHLQLHNPTRLHLHLQGTAHLSLGKTAYRAKKTPKRDRDSNPPERGRNPSGPRVHGGRHNGGRSSDLNYCRRGKLDEHLHC